MIKKQTPLTVEAFQEILMPQIKTLISESHDDLEEKIKHLPTKEEYFAREDKTMGELKKLRDEVALTGHHYDKTNKRIDVIDKHLSIDTSTVF
jgi:hypothetical protein